MNRVSIMNVRIDNKSMKEMLDLVNNKIKDREKYVIYTPNSEVIMMCQTDKEFLDCINKSDINIPDGIGVIYASKIKKHPLKEKVAGFDLSIAMLEMANRDGLKLYIVGGKPGVADFAAENIKKKYSNIRVVGTHHGYFKGAHINQEDSQEEINIINDINNKKPDILFVGFGAKKQEKWINHNKNKLDVTIFIGNGGTIDCLAGTVKRAPDIYIKLGLEWFYRLLKQPQRISRQIVLPIFMLKIIFGDKNIVKEID